MVKTRKPKNWYYKRKGKRHLTKQARLYLSKSRSKKKRVKQLRQHKKHIQYKKVKQKPVKKIKEQQQQQEQEQKHFFRYSVNYIFKSHSGYAKTIRAEVYTTKEHDREHIMAQLKGFIRYNVYTKSIDKKWRNGLIFMYEHAYCEGLEYAEIGSNDVEESTYNHMKFYVENFA